MASDTIPNGPAVDLGCGSGVATAYLARRFSPAIGLDFAESAVRQAKELALEGGVQADFLVAEVPHLPFRSGAFGFVFDRGCLQGMPRWLWPEYFVEVSRLLMPGGVLQLMLSKPERPSALSIKGLKARIRRAMPGKRSRGRLSPEGRVLRLRPASFQTLRREEFSFRTNTGRVRHFAHWVFQKT